jgi:Ino eighty subunit 1
LAPDEDDDWNVPSVRGRYKKAKRDSSPNPSSRQRIILKTKMDQTPDTASPAPPGLGHPILNQFVTEPAIPSPNPPSRRPRPLTQHQLAVEQNRRQRIEYLLAQRKVEKYQILRNQRQNEIPSIRYGRLLECLPEDYDTDAESSWGKGGLIPNPKKEEDFGESAHYFLSVIRKAARRLDRWDWENANGPKRDRKKEREERQKAYQNGLGAGGTLNLASSRAASGRSKPSRPKRKVAAPAGASGTSKKQSSNATARTKGNRTSTNRAGAPATATSGRNVKEPSSPSRQRKSPAAPEAEGDESLDDFDKQLLGEGGGHDEEDDRPRRRQTSFAADSDAHDENGYEDSFTGDHGPEGEADEEALSSENEDDHDDDVDDEELDEGEGEGGDVDVDAEIDGDSSASEVGNGYAASESYSENPDVGFDEDVEEMDDYSGEENGVDDEPVEED